MQRGQASSLKTKERRTSTMNYKERLEQEIKRLSEIQVKSLEEAIKIEQEIFALTPRNTK